MRNDDFHEGGHEPPKSTDRAVLEFANSFQRRRRRRQLMMSGAIALAACFCLGTAVFYLSGGEQKALVEGPPVEKKLQDSPTLEDEALEQEVSQLEQAVLLDSYILSTSDDIPL